MSYALASFAIATLAASQALTADESADESDRYVDSTYGFSFSKPRFTPSEEKDVATVVVTLAGPPVGTFAPNLNVIVQNVETDLDAYAELQREQLKSIGWDLVEQTRQEIGGAPALRTHARGSMQGLEVEFLAVTMIQDEKKAFVLTCTSTREQFPLYEAEFERVSSSLAMEPNIRELE